MLISIFIFTATISLFVETRRAPEALRARGQRGRLPRAMALGRSLRGTGMQSFSSLTAPHHPPAASVASASGSVSAEGIGAAAPGKQPASHQQRAEAVESGGEGEGQSIDAGSDDAAAQSARCRVFGPPYVTGTAYDGNGRQRRMCVAVCAHERKGGCTTESALVYVLPLCAERNRVKLRPFDLQ